MCVFSHVFPGYKIIFDRNCVRKLALILSCVVMAETRSFAKPQNHAGIHLLQDAPQGTDADVCRLVINSAENETYIATPSPS